MSKKRAKEKAKKLYKRHMRALAQTLIWQSAKAADHARQNAERGPSKVDPGPLFVPSLDPNKRTLNMPTAEWPMPNDLEQEALAESLKKQPGAGFTQGPDAGDEDRQAVWDDTKGSWIGSTGVQTPFTGIYEPGGQVVQPDGDGTLKPVDGDFAEVELYMSAYVQPPDPPSVPPVSTEDAIVAHLDSYIENLRSEITRLGLKLRSALDARRELKDEIPF